jgi:hypothetical protein
LSQSVYRGFKFNSLIFINSCIDLNQIVMLDYNLQTLSSGGLRGTESKKGVILGAQRTVRWLKLGEAEFRKVIIIIIIICDLIWIANVLYRLFIT